LLSILCLYYNSYHFCCGISKSGLIWRSGLPEASVHGEELGGGVACEAGYFEEAVPFVILEVTTPRISFLCYANRLKIITYCTEIAKSKPFIFR